MRILWAGSTSSLGKLSHGCVQKAELCWIVPFCMDFPPRVRWMVQRECSVWHNSWMGPPRHAPLKRMLQGCTGQNFKEDFPRIQCWKSWKKNKNRLQASVSKAAEVWNLMLSLLKKEAKHNSVYKYPYPNITYNQEARNINLAFQNTYDYLSSGKEHEWRHEI